MKVYIKAWQNIINPITRKVHDEAGLRALDAFRDAVYEVDELTEAVKTTIIAKFEKEYSDFSYDECKIEPDI